MPRPFSATPSPSGGHHSRNPDHISPSPQGSGYAAGSDSTNLDCRTQGPKWLRVVGPGSNTGAHYFVVYMGRGTHNVYTCWTPLGDVPFAYGPLALLVGSHQFERVKETYGKMDVDRDHVTGAFSNDPQEMIDRYGGRWRSLGWG